MFFLWLFFFGQSRMIFETRRQSLIRLWKSVIQSLSRLLNMILITPDVESNNNELNNKCNCPTVFKCPNISPSSFDIFGFFFLLLLNLFSKNEPNSEVSAYFLKQISLKKNILKVQFIPIFSLPLSGIKPCRFHSSLSSYRDCFHH